MPEACAASLGARVPCGSRPGPRWHCAWTHPQEESRAHRALCQQEFETYLPMIVDPRRREIAAMFPRYLFCRFDPDRDAWAPIRSTRGVGGIICHAANRPTPLPVGWVERLIARTSARGVVDDLPDLAAVIAPGTVLRVADGAFADMTGICQWSTARRVRMLITMLGREVPATVERSAVEAV